MLVLLTNTTGSSTSIWLALLAGVFTLAGAAGTYLIVGGSKGVELTELQDKTITAQAAELTLANQKITSLESQCTQLNAQINAQNSQILLLRDLVLQKAAVDVLIRSVDNLALEVQTIAEHVLPPKA